MKLFDGGILEIVLLTAFFAGVIALVCAVVCVAVLLVIYTLEAVDEYKNGRKW
jgi:hypothetical protein